MTRVRHLVGRFFGSLRARPLTPDDLDLVRDTLDAGELTSWERLGRADRAESLATAHAVITALGPDADPRWVAAALVHDVGKTESGLGIVGRAAATVSATIAGPKRARAWTGSVGRYVNHDELGADGLRRAGARAESVAWAAAHHRPDRWPDTGIPPEICAILAAADGEPGPR
jgi:hypothetical protein